MKRIVTLAVLVVWMGVLALPGPAAAEAPGTNGRILFIRDTATCEGCQLTTINPDGSSPHRIPMPTPRPGRRIGSRLASYVETADGRLGTVVFDADGTNQASFDIPDPTLNLPCTFWTPDATRLICEGWDDVHPHRAAGLFSISSTDGSDLVRITRNPYGGHDIPADVSPDGSQIVILRENPQPQASPDRDVHGQHGWVFTDADHRMADRRDLLPAELVARCTQSCTPGTAPCTRSTGRCHPSTIPLDTGGDLLRVQPHMVPGRDADRVRDVPRRHRSDRRVHRRRRRLGSGPGHRHVDQGRRDRLGSNPVESGT